MAIRVFDCWYHDQDIREALDRPGYLDGPVADLSLGRIPPKGLPYVVGKKAAAPPGSTVVFEVAGSPPLVAAVRVPPEGRAVVVDSAPTDPTVTLAMDRRTFSRLAGGRWNGDRARRAGGLRIDGDRDLGNRIVDNMAFTI
jgi:SCP-2 sterol transfer family